MAVKREKTDKATELYEIKNTLEKMLPEIEMWLRYSSLTLYTEYGEVLIYCDRVRFPGNSHEYLRKRRSIDEYCKYICDNVKILSNWDNNVVQEKALFDDITLLWITMCGKMKSMRMYQSYLPQIKELTGAFSNLLIRKTYKYAEMFGLKEKLKSVEIGFIKNRKAMAYLIGIKMQAIEETVINELCHFIYHGHGENFYIELENVCSKAGLIKRAGYFTKDMIVETDGSMRVVPKNDIFEDPFSPDMPYWSSINQYYKLTERICRRFYASARMRMNVENFMITYK